MSSPDTVPGFGSITPPDSLWVNAVAARIGLRIGLYRPGRNAAKIACPLLICLCEKDALVSTRRPRRSRTTPRRASSPATRSVTSTSTPASGSSARCRARRSSWRATSAELHRLRELGRPDGHGDLQCARTRLESFSTTLPAPLPRATTFLPLRATALALQEQLDRRHDPAAPGLHAGRAAAAAASASAAAGPAARAARPAGSQVPIRPAAAGYHEPVDEPLDTGDV